MTRRTRSLAGLLAVFALAFAQLAVSAFACQLASPEPAPMAMGHHPEGCTGPVENANVCNQHCQYGSAATDAARPLPALDAAVGPVVAVIAAPRETLRAAYASPAFSPANGPPPDARPLALRI